MSFKTAVAGLVLVGFGAILAAAEEGSVLDGDAKRVLGAIVGGELRECNWSTVYVYDCNDAVLRDTVCGESSVWWECGGCTLSPGETRNCLIEACSDNQDVYFCDDPDEVVCRDITGTLDCGTKIEGICSITALSDPDPYGLCLPQPRYKCIPNPCDNAGDETDCSVTSCQ